MSLFRVAALGICCLLFFALLLQADWEDADGNKMHEPQYPKIDDDPWSVNATDEIYISDDWTCSETGYVKDIHFWGSWKDQNDEDSPSYVICIQADVPANPPTVPFSHPGEVIWGPYELFPDANVMYDPVPKSGFYYPYLDENYPDDHNKYFQYNFFLDEDKWFQQEEGTVYWLTIKYVQGGNREWGWRISTVSHQDNAVWGRQTLPTSDPPNDWNELFDPLSSADLDMAFVINGGDGIGACCLPSPSNLCLYLTEDDCLSLAGVYYGDFIECAGSMACCLSDGSCINTDSLCCVNELGGIPQGTGQNCDWLQTACCMPDGSCQELDPLCCDEIGGTVSPYGGVCLGDLNGDGIDDGCPCSGGSVELDTVWTKQYGLPDVEELGVDVELTSDGGFIIAGNKGHLLYPGTEIWLLKTDEYGDTLWTKTYNYHIGQYSKSVVQTNDGGYIIAGSAITTQTGTEDVYVIKTDNVGDTVWTQIIDRAESDRAACIVQTNDNDYVLSGFSGDDLVDTGLAIVAGLSNSGVVEWTGLFCMDSVFNSSYGFHIEQTTDNGFIVACGSLIYDLWYPAILKLDANGDSVWAKIYDNIFSNSNAFGTSQTSDGGYIICGGEVYEPNNPFLIKTNSVGDTIWTRVYNFEFTYGWEVLQTPDLGYLMMNLDLSLLRVNSNGDSLWTLQVHSPPEDNTHSLGIDVISCDNYIIGGYRFESNPSDFDLYLVRIGEQVTNQSECGDANNDQAVNISDAVWIINYVFVGGDPPQPNLACGDANGDGQVNVSDAVWIINYVFVGGDPPGDCSPGDPDWIDGNCGVFTP
jgi:Dockerin type I domain